MDIVIPKPQSTSALLRKNAYDSTEILIPYQQHTLALPAGHLGVHFSETIPCEIRSIEKESPIFDNTLQFLGRIAFHLSIPNKIDIHGALDNITLESILAAYSDVPDRKLTFKDRCERFDGGLVTTTVLPTGRIDASFRSTSKIFPYRNKVFVERAGYQNFEFPIGHYVAKVIIPNQFIFEGGIRTPTRLFEILDHFSNVPGRKIVFHKNIPVGNSITKITLPKGPTGLSLYSSDDTKCLPIVSAVLRGSSSCKLNVPVHHIVEKLIIPNEITIERMGRKVINKVLAHFSNVEDRVIVLQEFHRNVPKTGGMVKMTLPTGKVGVTFKSFGGDTWVSNVKDISPIKKKCPIGYFVESLVIPGELELLGDELINAAFLSEKMKEFSHISHRVLVLKQYKKDIQTRSQGSRYNREFV